MESSARCPLRLLLLLLISCCSPALSFRRHLPPGLSSSSSSSSSSGIVRIPALPLTPRLPVISSCCRRHPATTSLHAWPTGRDPESFANDFPLAAARVGITIFATVVTYVAHANQRCSPVLASSAVTLAGSLVAPGLGQAAMCGTFTGMSSTALLCSLPWALGAGVLTSVLYEVFIHVREAALGLGGRLGTVAFVAVNALAFMQGINAVPAPSTTTLRSILSPSALRPGAPLAITLAFTTLGAIATIALREASDDQPVADPVRAAAVVGLLGALLVGISDFSELASLSVYSGAFVGMSLPSRLMRGVVPGKRPRRDPPAAAAATTIGSILGSFAVAGALAGMLHGLTLHLNWFATPAGWGGKAGACAFLGVALYRACQRAAAWVQSKGRGGRRAV